MLVIKNTSLNLLPSLVIIYSVSYRAERNSLNQFIYNPNTMLYFYSKFLNLSLLFKTMKNRIPYLRYGSPLHLQRRSFFYSCMYLQYLSLSFLKWFYTYLFECMLVHHTNNYNHINQILFV